MQFNPESDERIVSMMAHVLLIGERLEFHQYLKNTGTRLTLITTRDNLIMEHMHLYSRVLAVPPSTSIEEWIDLAVFVHKVDPFDAIGGFQDVVQDRAAAIAQKLGLPFHSIMTVATARYKDEMRSLLNKKGIDSTKNRKVRNIDDIESFAVDCGYPIILKPVDGRGSLGVSIIRKPSDIPSSIDWLKRGTSESEMYVEQYLVGEEVSVEAFSEHGKHYIICITKKYKENNHFVEVGHCLPYRPASDIETAICDLVTKTLTAIHLRNGASHTEVIITADGPRLVETHARAGGDQIPDLIKLATDIDIVDLSVQQLFGRHIENQLERRRANDTFAAIWYTTPRATGRLERVEGLDDAKNLPGVTDVKVKHPVGTYLTQLQSSYSRLAYAIAIGQDPEEALERAQAATKKLRFMIAYQGQG